MYSRRFLALAGLLLLCLSVITIVPARAQKRAKRLAPLSKRGGKSSSAPQPAAPICAMRSSLSFGQTVNGTLSATDCPLGDGSFFDEYTFNAVAGQQVAISLSSTAFDTYLFLVKPSETTVTVNTIQDDDGGGGTNSRIPANSGFITLPETGQYSILANSFDAGSTGPYTLSLIIPPAQAGQVVISELRFDGPAGGGSVSDDFIEIQNVAATALGISGCKLRIAYLNPVVVDVVIPNGTILLPGQHFLATNSSTPSGYTLDGYATGDVTYTIPVEGGAAFTLPDNTVIDQVGRAGFSSPFGEGTLLPPVSGFQTQNSYVRKLNSGAPQDTNNNVADFLIVAVEPSLMSGATLGAPGPENMQSPVQRNSTIKSSLIENCTGTGTGTPVGGCQNRVRLLTPDPLNPPLSPNGQLLIRRKFTNNTGAAVTRLRFRVVDLTTTPAPAGQADLRALNSQDITVVRSDGGGTVAVNGLTLEQPPAQPNGGGINSSLSAGTVTMGAPLANGAAIAVEFRLGIVQGGAYRFFVNVEALP